MPRVVQKVKTAGCGPADEGSIPSLGANMQVQYSGSISACHADGTGSNPVTCSIKNIPGV